MLIPNWLRNYKQDYLGGDLSAGITVGVMLIPQGMAYALIAGLPPEYGLYASIVPQLIYAFTGTSRQLSVGPVAMDSLLVASGVSLLAAEGTTAYISFAILVAFFMGSFQLLMGTFRLGFVTNLLSKPVISGFTSAAALIIALSQLKYLLGIEISRSNRFYEVVLDVFDKVGNTNVITFAIGLGGIVLLKIFGKKNNKIPGALIVVIIGITLTFLLELDHLGVSIVKEIPKGLPVFSIPDFSLGSFGSVLPLALTISVIAFMESFSVAKALEAKTQDHKVLPNRELVSLGVANLAGSFFQSYPVTGGFSRSAVNHQSGAKTPFSSIISAGLVGVTLLFLTPLFYHLPHAILASIIMVAVIGLFDHVYIRELWADNKKEFLVLAVTFLITLNIGMVLGILTGIILSILLFLYRSANPHIARLGRLKGHHEFRNINRFKDLETWSGIVVLRVDAPLSFINIQGIKEYIQNLIQSDKSIHEVIIDFGPVSYVDASAVVGLRELLDHMNRKEVRLVLCDIIGPVRDTMKQTGLTTDIGEKNLFLSLGDAIENVLSDTSETHKEVTLQTNIKT